MLWEWYITDFGATGKTARSALKIALWCLNTPFYRTFTSPDIPPVNYPEGFQGNEIPIDGTLVARICLERLNLVDEADD